MFSGMPTCQEAGVEQSNLRSALDVALKQGGSLGNMLVTFNIGTLMESLPICKIQSHSETSPCKWMCSISYTSHVPCWFFGARLNLSSTKSIVLTSSRCLQWLDGWKNAELPLCNHGLGFGNPSKTSLFLNRLDQNSDLSDFFWWYIHIYIHIFFLKANCYKVAQKKSPDSITSPSFSLQVMKLRRIACVRAWPITCATPGGVANCSRR